MLLRGDLHIHSTASDGSLSPRQIIMLAKSRGIDTIAISDHNSVDGILEASRAGKKYGVSVIPAVELSSRFNGESIHILGYFRNEKFNNTDFIQILKLVKSHRVHELRKILKGFREHPYYNKFLSSSEAINLLRTFEAAVVLAHPVRISKKNLPRLLNMPFDGIEAKYCRNNDYDTKFFIDLALKKFSFYTGGSDFHANIVNDIKHSNIGEPHLNSTEIRRFLKNSEALVLGSSVKYKNI